MSLAVSSFQLSTDLIRSRLARLAAHIVVAMVFLVVIGGATRVMEAGLACPDWPLCYGSLIPIRRMNLKVFLEWFHRLDALFVVIAISLQLLFSLIYKSLLPKWLPWINGLVFFLVLLQGGLGALTVIDLLPSAVVMGHLFLALTLLALMSGLSQRLLSSTGSETPLWWKLLGGGSLLTIIIQSLIGSRMATTWVAQRCIANEDNCYLLDMHRATALPVALGVCLFVLTSIYAGGWFRSQWPFFAFVLVLLIMQIFVGVFSVYLGLSEPLVRIFHQLLASLLVACLAAVCCRRPPLPSSIHSEKFERSSFEACHG